MKSWTLSSVSDNSSDLHYFEVASKFLRVVVFIYRDKKIKFLPLCLLTFPPHQTTFSKKDKAERTLVYFCVN